MELFTSDNEIFGAETQRIAEFFRQNSEVAVAFSGGVDSSVLLLFASRYAKRTKAYFVKSQFQPQFEADDAVRVAELLGAETEIIYVDVLSADNVIANYANRCYYCKKEIFGKIIEHAAKDGFSVILDGTNASDDVGDRPGFRALQELGVLSPLRICGFTKQLIRLTAKQYGLPVADKPSYACLATRIPTGTVISKDMLETTEKAENAMRELGFVNFRVRRMGGDAKIELSRSDFELFFRVRDRVYSVLSDYYNNVYLDLKERTDE